MAVFVKNKELRIFILSQGGIPMGDKVDAPASIGNSRARRSWVNKFISVNMDWGKAQSRCGLGDCCMGYPHAKIKQGDFVNPHKKEETPVEETPQGFCWACGCPTQYANGECGGCGAW